MVRVEKNKNLIKTTSELDHFAGLESRQSCFQCLVFFSATGGEHLSQSQLVHHFAGELGDGSGSFSDMMAMVDQRDIRGRRVRIVSWERSWVLIKPRTEYIR